MKLSIIVPVFNEGKTIARVLKKLSSVELPGVEKEIIVVNDGSTDDTAVKIRNQRSQMPNLKIIHHPKNMGKGAAVITGIKQATGDYVLIQDADLEYDPHYLKTLISPIEKQEVEVVYGTRLKRPPHLQREEKKPLFLLHYFGNRFLSFLTSLLYGQWITDIETGYKIFPKKAVEEINLQARGFDFEPEITAKLLKRGYRILEIPITTTPRSYEEGKKLNALRDGTIALWTLLKYRFIN